MEPKVGCIEVLGPDDDDVPAFTSRDMDRLRELLAERRLATRPQKKIPVAPPRMLTPRLAIVDTQSVKSLPVRGPRGFDAGKKVLGRKRMALVDADGNWLAVAVLPASVQDRDVLPALDAGKARWPSLRQLIDDGAFADERCRDWSHLHGMRHLIVVREAGQQGFVVLARRRVVERSLGWLMHRGGLLRDRAGRLDVAAGRLA